MKNITLFIVTIFAFAEWSNAQKSKIVGSWLMTEARVDGEIQHPYFITEFNEDGTLIVMGIDAGTWDYNKSRNAIIMKSEMDKDFNGEGKILTLTEKNLVVDKDDATLSYQKIAITEITKANLNSGLMGMWEFKDQPYAKANTLVWFKEPDEFSMIQKGEGSESQLSGTWIFDREDRSLIMIGLRSEDMLKGKSEVMNIDSENVELRNYGKIFKASKRAQNTTKIERLAFSEKDFYNEDGDYKYYDEEEKLPWRDWGRMKMELLKVKQLIYNCFSLIDGSEAFEKKILAADVKASVEEEGFLIDDIFYGFDRYNLPEDAAFPENPNCSNPLYPLSDETFRIVGTESITTPAGTFNCTVVESISESGARRKLWMITDRIGHYAKVIYDDPDPYRGHYFIFELQAIKE